MRLKADLLLLLVTVLWGSAFVVMRVAADQGSIFLLNGVRFLLGGLILVPLVKFKNAFSRSSLPYVGMAGLALFGGVTLQQAGLATTTAGNAGFITSLSVVFVPVLMLAGWRERPSWWTIAALVMAICGAFLLSSAGGFRIKGGDVYVLAGSFFWAMHIVVVGKAQDKIEALPFACGQFMVCGALGLIAGVFLESPTREQTVAVLPAVIYTGILSIAVGFTLQVFAQKQTPPTDAALILSMEGVFAAVFGWLFLREGLGWIQIAGCILILLAVLTAQVKPEMVKYRKRSESNP